MPWHAETPSAVLSASWKGPACEGQVDFLLRVLHCLSIIHTDINNACCWLSNLPDRSIHHLMAIHSRSINFEYTCWSFYRFSSKKKMLIWLERKYPAYCLYILLFCLYTESVRVQILVYSISAWVYSIYWEQLPLINCLWVYITTEVSARMPSADSCNWFTRLLCAD